MESQLKLEASKIKRKHRSSKEKLKYYNEWKESGLSRNKFCKLHNLKLPTFSLWAKRIEKRSASKTTFIPLEMVSEERKVFGLIEFEFLSGVKCRISDIKSVGNVLVLVKELHHAFAAHTK